MKSFMLMTIAITTLVNCSLGLTMKGSQSSYAYFSKKNPFKYSEIEDLIAFGDSYTTINANYTTMHNNGKYIYESKNWPMFLQEINTNLKIWDYAQGGAVVSKDIIKESTSISMMEQYDEFINNMSEGKKFSDWDGEKTLVTVWFGVNDIYGKFNEKNMTSEEFDNMVAEKMYEKLDKVYEQGVRNFMIMGVPPMENLPYFLSWDLMKEYSKGLTTVLNQHASKFHVNHSDANVFFYNSRNTFKYLMDHASEYNIVDTTFGCTEEDDNAGNCDRTTYFWRDGDHPTQKVQKLIAQDIDDFLYSMESVYKVEMGEEECWSMKMDYPCCKSNNIFPFYSDKDGDWGVVNNSWCGIPKITKKEPEEKKETCWGDYFDVKCCSSKVCRYSLYKDSYGEWGVENNDWCVYTSFNPEC